MRRSPVRLVGGSQQALPNVMAPVLRLTERDAPTSAERERSAQLPGNLVAQTAISRHANWMFCIRSPTQPNGRSTPGSAEKSAFAITPDAQMFLSKIVLPREPSAF
jgi:hypothetical protein